MTANKMTNVMREQNNILVHTNCIC